MSMNIQLTMIPTTKAEAELARTLATKIAELIKVEVDRHPGTDYPASLYGNEVERTQRNRPLLPTAGEFGDSYSYEEVTMSGSCHVSDHPKFQIVYEAKDGTIGGKKELRAATLQDAEARARDHFPADQFNVTVTPVKQHASDCAVHNEPAMPAGECTCGASSNR